MRLFLSSTWSMVRSISSCGNLDMMAVAVQQTSPLVPIASVEDIFEPHCVDASETSIRFISTDARPSAPTYPFSSVEKPWQIPNCILSPRVEAVAVVSPPRIIIAIPTRSLVFRPVEFSVRMEYPISISPCEWWKVQGELTS